MSNDYAWHKRIIFRLDRQCFFGTFFSVLRQDGVVEGGTGAMK